ncbi:M43 family zinc metalloprotease [Chryseobacterium sp.]|uniref:M43 family zinc metalloprotease n=1 Tax=Chryseobacterium sp. TaxID=1871047 RepID=UPI00162A2684|nr:M43 family zinc metalloprotease [Chryseobacterium sp.]
MKKSKEIKVFGKTYTQADLSKSKGFIRCATTEYETYLQGKYPNRMNDSQFEAWIKPLIEEAKNNKSQSGGIITIPVVVHVIHNGEALGVAPNITDEQVISQITVMNEDFRRMALTPGFNSNPVGADTMIQFALAKVDPNGNPTNGIDRVNMCKYSWSNDDQSNNETIDSTLKPATIWDPTQYMNMWSVRFSASDLLGYAQFPSNSSLPGLSTNGGPANTDGVVANYSTFGSIDYNINNTFFLNTPYDKGRTMTHEVGHFLGLRHIWGDDGSAAVCATDYCNDTTPAHEENYGCPSVASCTAGLFEMVENYMDYTDDACMNLFTVDQKARITAVMNNSPRRATLKTSTKDIAIPLFANDAEIKVERSCQVENCSSGFKLTLYNRGTSLLTSAVITYTVNGGTPQIYNWTGSLAQDKFSTFFVPVSSAVASGTVTAAITTVNGTADQRITNNTATGSYVSSPLPASYAFSTVVFTLQRDLYGSETRWELKNSAGTIVTQGGPYANASGSTLPPLITQTWNLANNTCYTFTIYDDYQDGICCGGGNGYVRIKSQDGLTTVFEATNFGASASKSFGSNLLAASEALLTDVNIYPNPATDILNITKVSDKATYTIHNTVGQIVSRGNVKNNKVSVDRLTKGVYIITLNYEGKTISHKFIKK